MPSSRCTSIRQGVTPTRVSDGSRNTSAPCGVDSISTTTVAAGASAAAEPGPGSGADWRIGAGGGAAAIADRTGGWPSLASRLSAPK